MELGGFFHRFRLFKGLTRIAAGSNLTITDAFYLNGLALVVGVLVALFVYLFKGIVNWASLLVRGSGETTGLFLWLDEVLRSPERAGGQLGLFHEHEWLVYVLPAIGGLAVGLIFVIFLRRQLFRGVSAVIEAVARRGGRLNLRRSGTELLNSGITIASGMSVGMEGPIVVAGSSIGSAVGQRLGLSATRIRTLLASGAAAGISAVFNAPIAGFFFALELILGDFRKKAVAAVVLASVSSNVTMMALTGGEKIFELPAYELGHWSEIVNFLLLGIICGLVAVLFATALSFADTHIPKLRVPRPVRTMLGGLAVGLIALFFPEILGTGHHTVQVLINGHFPPPEHLFTALVWASPVAYLLALCGAKLIATCITLGSGGAGGKFMPSLFMGSSIGGVFGYLVASHGLFMAESPASYALVGMATIFGSIAQAPLTVILLVFEMTGNYTMILPMMAAGVVSQVVFYSFRREGVFTQKLAEKGIKFGRGKDLSILESIPITRAMHKGVEVVGCDMPLGELRGLFEDSDHHGFPVVDEDGRLCGMVTTSDLVKHRLDSPDATTRDICTQDVLALEQDSDCHRAIALLEDYHIGRLPVVDTSNRPIGIVTRTDIIGAYKLALQLRAQELEESG